MLSFPGQKLLAGHAPALGLLLCEVLNIPLETHALVFISCCCGGCHGKRLPYSRRSSNVSGGDAAVPRKICLNGALPSGTSDCVSAPRAVPWHSSVPTGLP